MMLKNKEVMESWTETSQWGWGGIRSTLVSSASCKDTNPIIGSPLSSLSKPNSPRRTHLQILLHWGLVLPHRSLQGAQVFGSQHLPAIKRPADKEAGRWEPAAIRK